MELSRIDSTSQPVEETWATSRTSRRWRSASPGPRSPTTEGDAFHGSVKVKLGPIALVYNGIGHLRRRRTRGHSFVVDAKGKDKRGNGTAGAKVTLSMDGAADDSTDVEVLTDLAITGKPAQFGRGVMQDVSDKLLGQFVNCLEKRMGEGDGSAAPEPAAAEAASAEAAAPAAPAEPAAPAAAAAAPAAAAANPVEERAATPAAATSRDSDDALDLGRTVLPILAKSYWKQAVAGVVVVGVIVWVVTR